MKMHFGKALESNQYLWKDQLWLSTYMHHSSKDIIKRIETELEKRFSSLKIITYPDMILFHFLDDADLAAFQLWSYDGIEI